MAGVVRSHPLRSGRLDRSRVGPALSRAPIVARRAPPARDDRARVTARRRRAPGRGVPRRRASTPPDAPPGRSGTRRAHRPWRPPSSSSRPFSRHGPHRPRSPSRGRTHTRSTQSTSTGQFRSGCSGRRRPLRCRCASGWPAAGGCSTPRRPPNRSVGGSPPRRTVPWPSSAIAWPRRIHSRRHSTTASLPRSGCSRARSALGLDPSRVAIGGTSAGGNLAAAVTLRARERDDVEFTAQLLVYPVLLFQPNSASHAPAVLAPFLDRRDVDWCWSHYLSPAERRLDAPRLPVAGRRPRRPAVRPRRDGRARPAARRGRAVRAPTS